MPFRIGAVAERSPAFRRAMPYAGAAMTVLPRHFAPGQLQFITSSVYRRKCEQSWLGTASPWRNDYGSHISLGAEVTPHPSRFPMKCIGTAGHPPPWERAGYPISHPLAKKM